MPRSRYIILGAGGFAREAALHIMDYEKSENNEIPDFLFVDDVTDIVSLKIKSTTYKVIKDWLFPKEFCNFIVGIGNPHAKEIMVKKALESGLNPAKSIIHPRALVQDAIIGLGGIITPGVIITTNVIIGNYVILNLNTTIGHDTIIGNYVTCNPLCSISGNVTLEDTCFIGVGATVLEKKKIGRNSVIGAQACVTKNVSPNKTCIGIPAKEI